MAVLGADGLCGPSGSRRALLSEAWHIWRSSGLYAGSREELTPAGVDPWGLLPLAYVALHMLAFPGRAARLSRQTAQSHQLNRTAVRIIREQIEAAPLLSGRHDIPW